MPKILDCQYSSMNQKWEAIINKHICGKQVPHYSVVLLKSEKVGTPESVCSLSPLPLETPLLYTSELLSPDHLVQPVKNTNRTIQNTKSNDEIERLLKCNE